MDIAAAVFFRINDVGNGIKRISKGKFLQIILSIIVISLAGDGLIFKYDYKVIDLSAKWLFLLYIGYLILVSQCGVYLNS